MFIKPEKKPERGWGKLTLWIVLVAGAYFVGGWLGVKLTSNELGAALVWLPAGIALIAIFYIDWRLWPGIALGSILITTFHGNPWPAVMGIAAGSTCAALFAWQMLLRSGFTGLFSQPRDLVKFLLVGAVSHGMVSGLIGSASIAMVGIIPWNIYVETVLRWCLSDVLGVVILGSVVPMSLTLSSSDDMA